MRKGLKENWHHGGMNFAKPCIPKGLAKGKKTNGEIGGFMPFCNIFKATGSFAIAFCLIALFSTIAQAQPCRGSKDYIKCITDMQEQQRRNKQQQEQQQREEAQRNKAKQEQIKSLNAVVYDCLKPMTQFLKEVEEAGETMTSIQAEEYVAQIPKKFENIHTNVKKNCPYLTFYDVNVLDISKVSDKAYRIDVDPSNMLSVNIGVRKDVYIFPIIITDDKKVAANIKKGKQNIRCDIGAIAPEQKRSGLVTQWLLNVYCDNPVVVRDGEAPVAVPKQQSSTGTFTDPRDKDISGSAKAEGSSGGVGDILGGLMGGSADGIGTKSKGGLKTPSAKDIDMGSGDSSRSKAEIIAVVNARMPGLRNIYNKYLKLKPGFSGKVTLKFTIAPGGDIVSISIVSSTTGYGDFDNAVKNMVATWKWKKIQSGNTTPTIPFTFTE